MTTASFRIEIIPKCIYVGGSGPSMAPITMLPQHDKESWVIAELIEYGKLPHYVVHPKDSPVVRKIVRQTEIRNWVSPRVVEAFELEEGIRRDAQEEELEKEKERRKLTKNGKKRGRPFKYAHTGASASLVESIETETDTPDDADQPASSHLPQPSNPQLSLPRASLSQPQLDLSHKTDTPFDTETTEDEGIPGSMEPPPSKRSRTDMSEGPSSKTPRNPKEPLSSPQTVQKNPAPTSQQLGRSQSMAEPSTPRRTPSPSKPLTPQRNTAPPTSTSNSERRSLRDRSAQPFYGLQRSQTVHPSRSASPAKTRKSNTPARLTRSSSRSRNATPSGDLQNTVTKGWKSAPAKPSTLTPQKRAKPATPSKSRPARPAAESDDDKEESGKEQEVTDGKQWKVLRLLDDRYRMRKHRRCHYYLTQWAGDYAPTWERATNITNDLKVEYEAWKESPEGRAHRAKKNVENGGKASSAEKVVEPLKKKEDSPDSSSSEDDQVQASMQLENDIGGLFVPDISGDADAPGRLCADTPTAVKRERMEENIDELPLARSPYFPDHPTAAAAAESGDEEVVDTV